MEREMEIVDSWSLMAVVHECARITRPSSPSLGVEGSQTTSNTTTQQPAATAVDTDNPFPNPFESSFFSQQFGATDDTSNPFETSFFTDNNQFGATDTSNPFQTSFVSDDFFDVSSFFSDQVDASNDHNNPSDQIDANNINNSSQNDANINNSSLQNPIVIPEQFAANNNSHHPVQNPLSFPNQFAADNNNSNPVQNPLSFPNQFAADNNNNHPVQNPLSFSNQFTADDNNSNPVQNPLSLPNRFAASSSNSNGPLPPVANTAGGSAACDHNFSELFKNFSLPNVNPSRMEIEPLQDFREVSETPNSEQRTVAFQAGLQQIQAHNNDQLYLMPRRNRTNNNNNNNNRAAFRNEPYYTPRRSRKFENRVVHTMGVQELANDKWAWRKYGQKPIKGSPYPRNYYKCSSTKACNARKQVERCPIDPENYIVTYCGKHVHPCPPLRTAGGPRPRNLGLNPTPILETTTESPTSIMGTDLGAAGPSGSGSGSGKNVILLDAEEDEGDDAREEGSSSRGGNGEEGSSGAQANGYDYGYDLTNYGVVPDSNMGA